MCFPVKKVVTNSLIGIFMSFSSWHIFNVSLIAALISVMMAERSEEKIEWMGSIGVKLHLHNKSDGLGQFSHMFCPLANLPELADVKCDKFVMAVEMINP
jgi:hypothetical protein